MKKFNLVDLMHLNMNNVTDMLRAKDIEKFAASCDLSSKEAYLDWVDEYKDLVFYMERLSRRLKALRIPVNAGLSAEFNLRYDPEFDAFAPITNAKARVLAARADQTGFCTEAQILVDRIGNSMRVVYEARVRYKGESYKAMLESKAKSNAA